ncbi:MAG: TolC family protein [Sphingobacteriales bacterium]|nr:MAG: TolC family protein [Sphingobacteriales bacterium]
MHRFFAAIFIFLFFASASYGQSDSIWSLQRAVKFAHEHNISIQQNVLNERLAKLTLQQTRLSQIPNANISSSYGRSYGRSVDPTTNQFVQGNSYDFMSLSGVTDVLLFGWFQKRNQIGRDRFNLQAAQADLEQIRDDISLNVATGYLRLILAREQIGVTQQQVELSKAQYEQTRRFEEAGRVPELNVAQLEAQLAGDSANLITAISDYNAAILDMKALLNLDFTTPFVPQMPDVNLGEQIAVSAMNPEEIYQQARGHLGVIKASELRLSAAQKSYSAARGALWPQLSLSGQFGTNFASTFREVAGFNMTGSSPTGAFVQVPGTDITVPVYQPTGTYTFNDVPLFRQFDNNFRQTVALNLNIPVFNAWQAQFGVKQAKINIARQELNQYQSELKLKQDVYKAHNDAVNSIQKYNAAERAAIAARRAFDFAQKRYDLGLTNTVEYLTTQNTLYSAESRLASSKYDLIFKLKVIDYYLGKELKL